MNKIKRPIAAAELLLVFPGALFMAALIVRSLQPTQYEPAHTAQRLVDWYSARLILGLYVFLIALPLAALVIGCATVLRSWRSDAEFRRATLETLAAVRTHVATLLISGATLVAGGILVIVAVHMITES
jgi:cytochrome b561